MRAKTAPGIVSVEPASPARWDAAVDACPSAGFFHTRAWAEVWRDATGGRLRPEALTARLEDGFEALLPGSVASALFGLLTLRISSAAGTYGGWLPGAGFAPDGLTPERAEILWRAAASWSIEARGNPHDPALARAAVPWTRRDFTQWIDLAPGFDAIRRTWTKGHNAAAKKAARDGVVVRRAETLEDWRAYFEIYQDSLRRWGAGATSSHPWALFESLRNLPPDRRTLWLALHGDEPVSGALCLRQGAQIDYWHGASLASRMNLGAAHLLQESIIADAVERGAERYDMGPSGGHDGVVKFKTGFGAAVAPANVLIHRAPALRGYLRAIALAESLRPRPNFRPEPQGEADA